MTPTTSITQVVSAYWIFSLMLHVDSISSIMYVVEQELQLLWESFEILTYVFLGSLQQMLHEHRTFFS